MNRLLLVDEQPEGNVPQRNINLHNSKMRNRFMGFKYSTMLKRKLTKPLADQIKFK